MRVRSSLVLVLLILMFAFEIRAQENRNDAEALDRLRLELIEVMDREDYLRLRLEQLEYDLKPENIERALAGVGSTKPEELRAHCKRLLTIEKDNVENQLKLVESIRKRLQSKITSIELEPSLG